MAEHPVRFSMLSSTHANVHAERGVGDAAPYSQKAMIAAIERTLGRNRESEGLKASERGFRTRGGSKIPTLDGSPPTLKRAAYEMPEFIALALRVRGLVKAYEARPPYQRNDYVGHITLVKPAPTRLRRLNQMLSRAEWWLLVYKYEMQSEALSGMTPNLYIKRGSGIGLSPFSLTG